MTLRRPSDDQDSTTSVWLNYMVAIIATLGVFLTDWLFDKGILDGALIGMLITKAYDALTKQNEYFFPNERGGRKPNGEGTDKPAPPKKEGKEDEHK